jgi:hypothetical protein
MTSRILDFDAGPNPTATHDLPSLIIALKHIVASTAITAIKVKRLFQVINQGVLA